MMNWTFTMYGKRHGLQSHPRQALTWIQSQRHSWARCWHQSAGVGRGPATKAKTTSKIHVLSDRYALRLYWFTAKCESIGNTGNTHNCKSIAQTGVNGLRKWRNGDSTAVSFSVEAKCLNHHSVPASTSNIRFVLRFGTLAQTLTTTHQPLKLWKWCPTRKWRLQQANILLR